MNFSSLLPGSRVAVVGSRNFPFPEKVAEFVKSLPAGVEIVSGAGGVVDLTAAAAAREGGRPLEEFPADWKSFGRAAGPVRNRALAASGLACMVVFVADVARPSRGSASAAKEAVKAGVEVVWFGGAWNF